MKIKKIWIFFISAILLISFSCTAFANGNTDLRNKLDNQNKSILQIVKEKGIKNDSENENYEKVINSFRENRQNASDKTTTMKQVKKNIKELIFTFTISSRKYVVVLYMAVIVFYIILIAILGAKSIKNRKKWVMFCIIISFVFLMFINIPLFIIYTQNTTEVFTLESFYNNMFSFIFFMKAHSLVLSLILVVYGVINRILGKNDIPRRMLGNYLLKVAVILFVIMQSIATVIGFVV